MERNSVQNVTKSPAEHLMARQDDFGKSGAGKSGSGHDESPFSKLATVGLEIGAGAGLGAVVGIWVDRKWNCGPWGTVIGVCLGIASGMYLLIKEAIKSSRD
jgi:F0F1-type ATP synthase assembly protein I